MRNPTRLTECAQRRAGRRGPPTGLCGDCLPPPRRATVAAMLKTGAEHLASLRDGRAIYIADERIADVTAHPAFRAAAAMYAALYDMKADPVNRELLSFEEDGERVSLYFLRPRSREDLVRRTAEHRKIADFSYGLLG